LKIHFVKAGETLYEIGKKYGVTVEEIVAANKTIIDPNLIMEGMKLIIPVKQMQAPLHEPLHEPIQPSLQTPTPTMQAPIPADIIAPSIPHYPVQQNMPQQNMPMNQAMPIAQAMPMNQAMPIAQAMPMNQAMPIAQAMPMNQMMPTQQTYPNLPSPQQPMYPGLAVPPFAEIPVPAQQVIAPASMPNTSAWSLPSEFTAYNTPFHMTNYSMPYANPPQQAIAQPNSYYEPYSANSANAMPYPSNENYEYYNTYSSLNNHSAWPSHNAQPHAQVFGTQEAHNMNETNAMMEHEANENIPPQKENEKARTSAASITTRAAQPVKSKKNTLHDQVIRLHQSRNRR
jgi:hypothetical protein